MSKSLTLGLLLLVFACGAVADHKLEMRATLDGYQEVPSVSTAATGEFTASLVGNGTALEFTLSYSGLEGGNASAAHIHLGQKGVNGGVIVHLCGTGKPPCPATAGSISGAIVAADVVGPGAQGITAGEFDELLRAVRAGVTYVNVHNATFPGGEIRGQIETRGDRGKAQGHQ
jgi:hypothetical protein